MRMLMLIALLAMPVSSASAGWEVNTYTDQLTDRSYSVATLETAGAVLRVRCLNGSVTPEIVFNGRVGWTRIGMAYRFDSNPVTSHMVFLADDARTTWPWITDKAGGVRKIMNASRLRVQIFPTGYDPLFFEFDLIGAKDAVSKVKCR